MASLQKLSKAVLSGSDPENTWTVLSGDRSKIFLKAEHLAPSYGIK
jgi:hypothetical protein